MYNSYKVGAVIVLYEPDLTVTIPAIKALAPQVDRICLIDNTPGKDNSAQYAKFSNVHYIPLKENKGIAAAQNIGISYFEDTSFDFIIFSDQDSVASDNIVCGLLTDYLWLKAQGHNIGIIGPTPINKCTGEPYGKNTSIINQISSKDNKRYVAKHYIISSFSLVPVSLFSKIGLFHEELFIDFVETEWCFRLIYKENLLPFLSSNLKILHELGKSDKFLGKQISISSPFRIYFQIRNFIWVSKLSYTPKEWKAMVLRKLILKCIYYPIVPSNRFQYIMRIIKGFKDGAKNPDFITKIR